MGGGKTHKLSDEAWLLPLSPFHEGTPQGFLSGTFYRLGETVWAAGSLGQEAVCDSVTQQALGLVPPLPAVCPWADCSASVSPPIKLGQPSVPSNSQRDRGPRRSPEPAESGGEGSLCFSVATLTSLTLCSSGCSQSLFTSQWLSRKVRVVPWAASAPRIRDRTRPARGTDGQVGA